MSGCMTLYYVFGDQCSVPERVSQAYDHQDVPFRPAIYYKVCLTEKQSDQVEHKRSDLLVVCINRANLVDRRPFFQVVVSRILALCLQGTHDVPVCLLVDDCLEHYLGVGNDWIDGSEDKTAHHDEICFVLRNKVLYEIGLYQTTAALENLEQTAAKHCSSSGPGLR